MNLMLYLTSLNFLTFILGAIDKYKAIHHHFRIPEKVLLTISLLGGCFGMALAMIIFNHKTRKLKFKFVYLFCLLWLYLFSKLIF